MKTDYWIMVNGEKVYQTEKPKTYRGRNEDMTDFEMENILAGLHMDNFNEDEYYHLKYERMQDYF